MVSVGLARLFGAKMNKVWTVGPAPDRRAARGSIAMLRRIAGLFALLALVAVSCGSSTDDAVGATVDPTAGNAEVTDEAQVDAEPAEQEPTTEPETESEATPDSQSDTADEASDGEDSADELSDEEIAQFPLAAETIDWQDCEFGQCGTVTVPIDYDDPSVGTLDIAVSIVRATDLDNRIGYLFTNPGGPGGTGVDMTVKYPWTEEIIERFDIVGFDPRGVGASEPTFACGKGSEQFDLLQQIDEFADTPEEVAIGNQAAQLCVDSMGPAAIQLGTDEVVRDIDSIREALGVDQISYIGFSYGSTIGAWYASVFPDNVRAMVVDGAENPTVELDQTLEGSIELLQASFGPLEGELAAALESCSDETCPMWNDGDPIGYWEQAAAKFDLVIAEADGNKTAGFSAINGFLYTQATWPDLHDSVVSLVEDDDATRFIEQGYARSFAGAEPTAVKFSEHVGCLDAYALKDIPTLEEAIALGLEQKDAVEAFVIENFPLLAATDAATPQSVCTYFDSLEPPKLEGSFDGGGVPILVVGNPSDPVTNFVQSEQLANDVLTNGRLVKVDHFMHVVYPGNTCVNDFVHAALIDIQYPDGEVECEEEAPVAAPGWESVELVDFELDNGATSLAPAGWDEVEPGVWFRPGLGETVFAFDTNDGSVEASVADFEERFGATPELGGEIPGDGFTWSIYELSLGPEGSGAPVVRFAATDEPDGTVITGFASPDDIGPLTDLLLLPALEAYAPAG